MKRYGMVIRLQPGKVEEYIELHKTVWPSVLARISVCNLRNYSIFVHQLDDGRHYLFAYFEYTGSDFAKDMAKIAADLETQRWWQHTQPCQDPIQNRAPGEWWASMREVFHHV